MRLDTVVAAADESPEGHRAALLAADVAARSGGRVIVLRIVPPPPPIPASARTRGQSDALAREQVARWIGPDLEAREPGLRVDYVVQAGLPRVEISRVAEEQGADLLVLGRKRRSAQDRLLLGDTADAVARRSRLPCLFTPGPDSGLGEVLAALDGTDRGFIVFREAAGFAHGLGATLRAVFVEPAWPGEPESLALDTPGTRLCGLRRMLDEAAATDPVDLAVRRGDPAEQILAEAEQSGTGVLVLGYHRGGPAGVIEGRSVARHLVHSALCAVLTIPL